MADNVTLPGTAAVIEAFDIGSGVERQVVLSKERYLVVVGSTVTRPANVTAYAANDAVSNNATASSVTAISFTLSDLNDAPVALESCKIESTDTGVAGQVFRLWLYASDPTASTGIVGGDNAAFSVKKAGFVGTMVGTFRTFSDGSSGIFTPEDGARILTVPGATAKTIWGLLQTLNAFTPSANSTTFIPTLRAVQGSK